MDTTGNQAALIEVPRDDGSIDRAIDALDTKITAWVQAVEEAQRVIAETARRAATQAAQAPAAPSAPPQPAAAKEEAGDKMSGGMRLGHLTAKKPPAETVRKGIRVYEEETPEPINVKMNDGVDPDEALLDTLDPKLAKQIRMRRRLCNNAKSIRQLLDEMKK